MLRPLLMSVDARVTRRLCQLKRVLRPRLLCSFECTFCSDCSNRRLAGTCPNCGGELLPRPSRSAAKLQKYPGSTTRVFKPEGCAAAT
ncbi:DUF1272 domain-containing protein [Variovorax paradoxus]|uniref:DUF1272 domain-containing protein n=1 Tax=Variovorax paradoxus TaxID=34073 RepID=UPI00358E56A5